MELIVSAISPLWQGQGFHRVAGIEASASIRMSARCCFFARQIVDTGQDNLDLIDELPEGLREIGLLRLILGFERNARNFFEASRTRGAHPR